MRLVKRLALIVYVLACVAGVGALALVWAEPWTGVSLAAYGVNLRALPFSAVLACCLGVVALGALVVLLRALFSPRPAPRAVHPAGSEHIEVTVRALESSVRAAVEEGDAFLVESVAGKVRRRKPGEARFDVEVIPLVEENLRDEAGAAQKRAAAACERLMGVACADVRVKVLPAKTVTVRKESNDE